MRASGVSVAKAPPLQDGHGAERIELFQSRTPLRGLQNKRRSYDCGSLQHNSEGSYSSIREAACRAARSGD